MFAAKVLTWIISMPSPAGRNRIGRSRRSERLEDRTLLSAVVDVLQPAEADASALLDPQALIVAGDPDGSPADSPDNRIDPNTTTSLYAGVGSLQISFGGFTYICTATAISPTHVLTAGHCVDLTDDGVVDVLPSDLVFHLNYGSDISHSIVASSIDLHPDYTGFANPSVNDDLAVIELSSPLPAGVPIYAINTDPFVDIETVTMVGYGTSGDGENGYTVSPSFSVKRVGYNHTDVFISDDEGSAAREVFQFDFDGPHKRTNLYGSPQSAFNLTLGNDVEGTLGGGDSGGPSFIDDGFGNLEIFGVNTFGFGQKAPAPLFGSGGGGIVVSYYADWIAGILGGTPIDTPPTVALTNPIDGQDVSNTVSVTANAGDDDAVAQVEFFVNGTSIGVDGDGSDGWSIDWDTTSYAEDAEHTVTATATDSGGLQTSDSVSVTVNNEADPPPAELEMYVWEISWFESQRGPNTHLEILVDMNFDSDTDGTAEAGDTAATNASVTLLLTNESTGESWTYSGTTDGSGQVMFRRAKAPAGNYQAAVTTATHATYVWNMALDADNPDTYNGLPGGNDTSSPLRAIGTLPQSVSGDPGQDLSHEHVAADVKVVRTWDSAAIVKPMAVVEANVMVESPGASSTSLSIDTSTMDQFSGPKVEQQDAATPATESDDVDDWFIKLPELGVPV